MAYTDKVQRALVHASHEAKADGSTAIMPIHLLKGLIREEVLQKVTLHEEEILDILTLGRELKEVYPSIPSSLMLSPRGVDIMQEAVTEARKSGQTTLTEWHLLIVLLHDDGPSNLLQGKIDKGRLQQLATGQIE